MTVTEALQRRQATRAFLDRPVPGKLLETLIEQAGRSPSGGNLQPWHVHALTGASLEQLKATVRDKLDRSERETGQYAIYPSDLWEPLRGRRREAGGQRYAALGISREMDGQAVLERMNFEFFGAPVGLFFAIDRRCGPPQWADLGMFMQSLMLLAVEHGLASCPQEVWSVWPETVARHVGLSANLILFAGMSLGYADSNSPMNGYRTARVALDSFASFHGFDER